LESLPKLTNINPLGSAHPDAVVLAEALVPGDAPPRRLPLLVAREPGRGRTLTLATDALWHWRVHQGPTSTAARAYDRFWQQALLWLTHDPATAALKLSVSGQGVAEGPLEVVATLPQPTGPDAPSGALQVHLDLEAVGETPAGLDGAPRLATVQPDGRATFQLPALPPGAYRLTARAGPPASRPQELTAQAHVVVQPQGPELTHLAVQPALLQAVSAATGGQVLPPDAPSTVVERVPVALAQPPIVLGRRRLPLWDNGYALILVLGTLTLEWWARRRVGLP
jgi:hypothetical protein